jgi:hypothetical protein
LDDLVDAAWAVIDYAKAHEPRNRQDFERLEAAVTPHDKFRTAPMKDGIRYDSRGEPIKGDADRERAILYERRVEQVAAALHADCILAANARLAIDRLRDPWERDLHGTSRHYGQAHDLVRRIWPKLDRVRSREGAS